MSDIAIDIQNLSKVYKLYDKNIDRLKEAIHPLKRKYHRPFYALKNVNLSVKKGEILGIIGRNGAGKSTLAGIISGVITQTEGNCLVKGKVSPLLGLAAGFNPELTGMENIYLNGMIKGFTKKEMEAKIDDILTFADIGDFIYQPVKTYSSGMNARLSFGVAINIEPDILILDEVLSVGDELFKRKCYARMEELFNSGCTVLYVSHSLNSINEICSRVILIDQGEQILEGPAKLVTMYYQKLLYALKEEQASVRQEIIVINKDQNAKNNYIAKIEEGLAETAFTGLDEEDFKTASKAYFIPNFVSKSTVEYKNYDVKVKDICIKTLNEEKVNALVTSEKYIFSYKVKFNIPAENVEFSMAIKTEKGFFISGKSKQVADSPEKIKAGDGFLVEWFFRCNLLGGNYYLNIGIKSLLNGEVVFLNRIVDALVFKVQQDSEGKYTGIVHFDQQAKITPIAKR